MLSTQRQPAAAPPQQPTPAPNYDASFDLELIVNRPLPIPLSDALSLLFSLHLPPTPIFGPTQRADALLAAKNNNENIDIEIDLDASISASVLSGPPTAAELGPERASSLLAVSVADSLVLLRRDSRAETLQTDTGNGTGKWKYAVAKIYSVDSRPSSIRWSPDSRWVETASTGAVDADVILATAHASSNLTVFHNNSTISISLYAGPVNSIAWSHGLQRIDSPQLKGSPARVLASATDSGALFLHLVHPTPTPNADPILFAKHKLPATPISVSFHPTFRNLLLVVCTDGVKLLDWHASSWIFSTDPFPGSRTLDGSWGLDGRIAVLGEGRFAIARVGKGVEYAGEAFRDGGLVRFHPTLSLLTLSSSKPTGSPSLPSTSEVIRIHDLSSRTLRPLVVPLPAARIRSLSWHANESVLCAVAGDAVVMWRI